MKALFWKLFITLTIFIFLTTAFLFILASNGLIQFDPLISHKVFCLGFCFGILFGISPLGFFGGIEMLERLKAKKDK